MNDEKPPDEKRERVSQKQKVVTALSGGSKTTAEIADATGIPSPISLLCLMENEGLLTSERTTIRRKSHLSDREMVFPMNRWSLTERGAEYGPRTRRKKASREPFPWIPS